MFVKGHCHYPLVLAFVICAGRDLITFYELRQVIPGNKGCVQSIPGGPPPSVALPISMRELHRSWKQPSVNWKPPVIRSKALPGRWAMATAIPSDGFSKKTRALPPGRIVSGSTGRDRLHPIRLKAGKVKGVVKGLLLGTLFKPALLLNARSYLP